MSIYATYSCLGCGEEVHKANTRRKFCSNKCQGRHRFINETVPRFFRGEISSRETIRKVLTETNGYYCDVCKIGDWNKRPITLQVDHIDGNPSNNEPENFRLICPNCHSQTSSYGSKNKGRGRKSKGVSLR